MVKTQGPQGWIAVDLDGTLAEYHGWTKWNEFGKPISAMVERIKGWLAEGKDVRIFTARINWDEKSVNKCYKTGETFTNVDMKYAIANYTEQHIGQRLRAQCYKDLHCIEIWDDRAVGVVANTGQTLVDAGVAEYAALQGKVFQSNEDMAEDHRSAEDARD
jgi:hypothetical protein